MWIQDRGVWKKTRLHVRGMTGWARKWGCSQPSCKIFSTHDDFSIMHKLDQSSTSAVTNLRHPLDRVLSTYEFSVEVAARFLRLKKGLPGQNPFLQTKSTHLVSTLSIWPWKYLVPFMQRDIFMRVLLPLCCPFLYQVAFWASLSFVLCLKVFIWWKIVYWRRWIHTRNNYWWVGWQRDARLEGRVVHMAPSANTSYDAASIVMSLLEFIHHPVAHELVHNGAMFQVFLVFLTPHVFLFPLSGNNNQDQIFFSNFVGIYFLSIFSRWLQVHGVTGGCRDILGVPVASEWCGNPL